MKHIKLFNAWEFNCGGDWSYDGTKSGDAEEFEEDHPGLLGDIVTAIREGRTEPKITLTEMGR